MSKTINFKPVSKRLVEQIAKFKEYVKRTYPEGVEWYSDITLPEGKNCGLWLSRKKDDGERALCCLRCAAVAETSDGHMIIMDRRYNVKLFSPRMLWTDFRLISPKEWNL